MQRKRNRTAIIGRKALSTFMAVVLAVGLVPLPAFGEGGVVAGSPAGDLVASIPDEQRAVVASEADEDADIVVPDDIAEMDFSTQRVIVAFDSGTIDDRDQDNVVSEGDSVYLLQYKNVESAQKAYMRYEGRAGIDYVAPDIVIDMADDAPASGDVDATDPADAPLAALDVDAVDSEVVSDAGDEPVVALIDTGAPQGDSRVTAYFSSLSSGELYDNSASRHGTSMLYTMAGEDPDVKAISIKALDENGRGTAATVSAAISKAIEEDADIINLSFAGKATTSNAAINAAVEDAVNAGKTVIVAAGNGVDGVGVSASLYTPANADGAFTVGSAAEDGTRQAFSNYGDCVDAYVKGVSTSRSAARTSGWLSSYLKADADASAWQSSLLASGIVGDADVIASEVADLESDEDWVVAADPTVVSDKVNIWVYDGTSDQIYSTTKSALAAKAWYLKVSDCTNAGWTGTPDTTGSYVYVVPLDDANSYSDATTKVTKPLSDGATVGTVYKYMVCWKDRPEFVKKAGGSDLIYRYYVNGTDGKRHGYMASSPATTSSESGYTLEGWDSAAGGAKLTTESAIATDAATTYYETCYRDFTVILGATGGNGSMNENLTTVRQSYDGAAAAAGGSGYSLDTSNLAGVTWSTYVPNSQWGLAGFQVSLDGERVAEDGQSDAIVYPALHAASVADLATQVSDASAVYHSKYTQAMTGDSIYLNAVYGRKLTVKKYLNDDSAYSSGGGSEGSDYKTESKQQLMAMARGTIGATSASSDPIFTLADPDFDGYTVSKWTYSGGELTAGVSKFASDLDMTRGWTATSPVEVKMYASSKVEDDTKYTVKFVDGSATVGTQKTMPVGATDISAITPTTLDSTYTAPTGCTFAGWALAEAPLTSVTSVGGDLSAGDTVTVQAIWRKTPTIWTGNRVSNSTLYQYWNRSNSADVYSLQIPTASLPALGGWTTVGWTTSSGTPSDDVVPAYARASATTGSSGDWEKTSTGWTYTGSADTLRAVYSRSVALTYEKDLPSTKTDSDLSGTWPTGSTTQYYLASSEVPVNASFTLTTTGFELSGYDFDGWSETAGGSKVSTSYSKAVGLSDTATVTLHARWSKRATDYTVKFLDGTGSSNVIGTIDTEAPNATSLSGVTPTSLNSSWSAPANSTFYGWALPSAPLVGVSSVGSGSAAGDTVTVQAVWKRDVTLHAGASGSEILSKAQSYNRTAPSYSLDVASGKLSALSGWTSVGWMDSAGTPSDSATTVKGTGAVTYTGSSADLYAVYKRDVTLKYNLTQSLDLEEGDAVVGVTNGQQDTEEQYYRTSGTPTTVSFTLATASAGGYTFNGWTETSGGTTTVSSPYEQAPAVGTSSPTYNLYDKWTKSTTTTYASYTVRHYEQTVAGTYPSDPYSTVVVPNTPVGQSVSGVNQASPRTGFEFSSSTPSTAQVASDNSTAFDIRYKRKAYHVSVPNGSADGTPVSFYVTSTHASALGAKDGQGSASDTTAAYGDTVTITQSGLPEGWTITGYTVTGASSTTSVTVSASDYSGTFTMPAESISGAGITVTALLAPPQAATASYTVNHFKQDLDGNYGSSPDSSETVTGITVGTEITGAGLASADPGFVYESVDPTADDVAADNSTKFDVKYRRAVYKVTVPSAIADGKTVKFAVSSAHVSAHAANGAADGAGATGVAAAAYGDTVTITPSDLPDGWRVSGYTVGGATTQPSVSVASDGKGTFTMPIESSTGAGISITASLTSSSVTTASYTVNHYNQNVDGSYNATPDHANTVSDVPVGNTITGSGLASVTTGFVYDSVDPATAVVASDNSTKFDVRYRRAVYRVNVPDASADTATVTFSVSSAHVTAHEANGAANGAGTASATKAAFGDTVTITPSDLPTGWRIASYTIQGATTQPSVSVASDGKGTFTMPAESVTGAGITVTALLAQSSANTATYTVNHFKQTLDAEYPSTPDSTDTEEGVIGQSVAGSSAAKAETGFTFLESTPDSLTIAASGSSMDIKYQRLVSRVYVPSQAAGATNVRFDVESAHSSKFSSQGAQDGVGTAVTTKAAYGDTVTVKPRNLPRDYKVVQYIVANATTYTAVTIDPTTYAGTFEMPAEQVSGIGITVAAILTSNAAEYHVGHYLQQLDATYAEVAADREEAEGAVGDPGTGTPKAYEGFAFASAKAEYGTIQATEGDEPTVKLRYDRVAYEVVVPSATENGTTVTFSVAGQHATALGTAAGTVAYGDTAVITPTGLPEGYGVEYEVSGASPAPTVLVDSDGVGTFAMPIASDGVTVTATLVPDANWHRLTVDAPHVGVAVEVNNSTTIPSRLKEGMLVILTATPEDGYGIDESATWTLSGATELGSTSEALVFFMGTSDVTVTAPLAYSQVVERAADGTSVTTTTSYEGDKEKATAVAKDAADNVTSTTYSTTEVTPTGSTLTTYYSDAARSVLEGTSEAVDDGEGTVTETRKDSAGSVTGSTVTDTAAVSAGKTRSTVTEMDAYGNVISTEVVTSETAAGVTVTTTVKSSDGMPVVTGDGTAANPRVVTETTQEETTVSITTQKDAVTTIVTQAPVSDTVTVVTTTPAEGEEPVTIGGEPRYDATKVVRTDSSGTTTQYYCAYIKNSANAQVGQAVAPGTFTVGYASDDTDVASADATFEDTGTTATVNMKSVTPKGGTAESGTSTMEYANGKVTSLTATTPDGVTFSLTRKALAALDASKYRYALVVAEADELSLAAEGALSKHFSDSYETRAYTVSLYRIATGAGNLVAGTVSQPSEAELAAFGVTVGLGEALAGMAAHVGRVSDGSFIDLGSSFRASDSGALTVSNLGGTGEMLVGLGEVRTVTYASNYPSAVTRAGKNESYSPTKWLRGSEASVLEVSPIELSGWSVVSWNTEMDNTGTAYAPGDTLGAVDENVTLYAQWKWNLSEDYTADKGYGTKLTLYSDAAKTKAYAATYNGTSQAPAVKVETADDLAYKAGADGSGFYQMPSGSYVVTYEKKYDSRYDAALANRAVKDSEDAAESWIPLAGVIEGDASGAASVVNAGTYRARVTALADGKAAPGTTAVAEFSINRTGQNLTAAAIADQVYAPSKTFKVSASVAAPTGLPDRTTGKISYASSDTKSVTVAADGTATIKGANVNGLTITVTAAETQNYSIATKALRFKVNKGTQTITAPASYSVQAGKTAAVGAKLSNAEGTLSYASEHNARIAMTAAGVGTGIGCNTSTTITVTAAETANYKAAAPVKIPAKVTSGLKLKAVKATQSVKRSKKTTIKVAKAIKVTSNTTKGAVSYARSSVGAKAKKYVTVDKKGNITVKKGCPKGTYTLKVKGTAKAKSPYKAQTATVSIKIKVS